MDFCKIECFEMLNSGHSQKNGCYMPILSKLILFPIKVLALTLLSEMEPNFGCSNQIFFFNVGLPTVARNSREFEPVFEGQNL